LRRKLTIVAIVGGKRGKNDAAGAAKDGPRNEWGARMGNNRRRGNNS